jgi:hypothetical protein
MSQREGFKDRPILERLPVSRAVKDAREIQQVRLPRRKLRESPWFSSFEGAKIDIFHSEFQCFPSQRSPELTHLGDSIDVSKDPIDLRTPHGADS